MPNPQDKRLTPHSLSRRTFLQLAGVGLASGALLAACAPTAAPAPAATAAEAGPPASAEDGMMRPGGTPKRGGTLRAAFGVTTSSYDIQQGGSGTVLTHMYNNLVRFNLVDGLNSIIGDLASTWDVSDDGLVYTFHLREGVKFHDGADFSADDAVATFNRIINPPEGIVIPSKDMFSMVKSVEAPDAKTVVFTLNSPRIYFLNILADPGMIIYSKKTLEDNKYDLREVQVAPGTGAFKFVEYKTAEKWTLERNPDYWDKELPYVDKLELIHVPAWSDRGTAVLTDQADLSWNVSFETWSEGENRPNDVVVRKLANFGAYWMLINTKKEPFGDARVRRAIQLGISRQNLIKAFGTQEQINLTRWIAYGDPFATPPEEIAKLPGYREDKTQDIADAKKLLADAGFPDGIKGVEILAATGPQAELLATAFQDMLKRDLNIEATIRTIERSQLAVEEKNGNFTLVIDTPGGPALSDISPTANLWWRTNGTSNWGGYSNPDFDKLLDQIDVEIDKDKRQTLINQMMDLLDQDAPWFLIGYTFHLPMWRATTKGTGLELRTFAQWGRLETAWLDK